MSIWETTLSPKGQITIPKAVRDALGLEPGDQMVLSVINGDIIAVPKNIEFNDLAGLLGNPPNGPATLEDIDRAVVAAGGANALATGDEEEGDVAA